MLEFINVSNFDEQISSLEPLKKISRWLVKFQFFVHLRLHCYRSIVLKFIHHPDWHIRDQTFTSDLGAGTSRPVFGTVSRPSWFTNHRINRMTHQKRIFIFLKLLYFFDFSSSYENHHERERKFAPAHFKRAERNWEFHRFRGRYNRPYFQLIKWK